MLVEQEFLGIILVYEALIDEIFDGRSDAMFVSRPEDVLGHITRRIPVGCDFIDQFALLWMSAFVVAFIAALLFGLHIVISGLIPAQLVQLFYIIIDLRTTFV